LKKRPEGHPALCESRRGRILLSCDQKESPERKGDQREGQGARPSRKNGTFAEEGGR